MSRFVSQAVHGWWDGFSFLLSGFWFELSYWFNKIHDCALSFVSPISENVEKTKKSHDRRPWPSPSSQVALPGLHDASCFVHRPRRLRHLENGELSVALLKSLFLTSRASCMRCRKLLIFVDIVGTSWSYFPGIWSKGREWFLMFSLVALLDSWLARLPWAFFRLSSDATCRLAVRAVKLNGFQSVSLLFNFTESDLPAGPLDARLYVLHCKEICSWVYSRSIAYMVSLERHTHHHDCCYSTLGERTLPYHLLSPLLELLSFSQK